MTALAEASGRRVRFVRLPYLPLRLAASGLEAVARAEEGFDVGPRLPDLPRLCAWLFPQAGAEPSQVQFVLCVVIQAASIP